VVSSTPPPVAIISPATITNGIGLFPVKGNVCAAG
jgi:hypothetical protein